MCVVTMCMCVCFLHMTLSLEAFVAFLLVIIFICFDAYIPVNNFNFSVKLRPFPVSLG